MTPSVRRATLLATPFLAVLLGACSNDAASVTSAAAKSTYEPILRDVAAATAADLDLAWTNGSPPVVQSSDTGCTWHSTTLASDVDLGVAKQWPAVQAATKQALAKHGFSEASDVELPGGYTGVEATDDKGATLRIESKGRSSLRIVVPVGDGC